MWINARKPPEVQVAPYRTMQLPQVLVRPKAVKGSCCFIWNDNERSTYATKTRNKAHPVSISFWSHCCHNRNSRVALAGNQALQKSHPCTTTRVWTNVRKLKHTVALLRYCVLGYVTTETNIAGLRDELQIAKSLAKVISSTLSQYWTWQITAQGMSIYIDRFVSKRIKPEHHSGKRNSTRRVICIKTNSAIRDKSCWVR